MQNMFVGALNCAGKVLDYRMTWTTVVYGLFFVYNQDRFLLVSGLLALLSYIWDSTYSSHRWVHPSATGQDPGPISHRLRKVRVSMCLGNLESGSTFSYRLCSVNYE